MKPLAITTRSRMAWVLSITCLAALLGACGQESPGASSPKSPASTSPTKTVAPSPKKVAPAPKKRVLPTLRPGRCAAAAPTTATSPTLDGDVCQAIVGYIGDSVVVKAKVDPTLLSQAGARLHGFFDSPSTAEPLDASRWWAWKAMLPMGVPESHQVAVQNAVTDIYGCGSQGMGHGDVPTVAVGRARGIIKVVIPSRCISEQGVGMAPKAIRASVNFDTFGDPDEIGVERAYFTDRLFLGDVAVQHR